MEDLWKQRLARIGEQFSQCDPFGLTMIREGKPVNDAAHKAALASVLEDAAFEANAFGQSHVRGKMRDDCFMFGWGDTTNGSICFYSPALRTMPYVEANVISQRVDELFATAGGVLDILPDNVRSQLSPLALSLASRKLRWATCVFDMALRKLPGMTAADMTYLGEVKPGACWHTTLKNVMAASVEFIDRLLTATPATTNAKPEAASPEAPAKTEGAVSQGVFVYNGKRARDIPPAPWRLLKFMEDKPEADIDEAYEHAKDEHDGEVASTAAIKGLLNKANNALLTVSYPKTLSKPRGVRKIVWL